VTDDTTLSSRVTAPMQEFSTREVGIGLVVAAVGVTVAFVLPFVLA